MSTYPGEDPQQPSDQPHPEEPPAENQPPEEQPVEEQPVEASAGNETELTQPVGYWERQAAEHAAQQAQQGDPAQGGAVFNPTTAQQASGWEQPPTTPYEQQNPYGQPAYGQPPQQPYYPQPGYGQQPPYNQPPGYAYPPPPGGQSGPHPGVQPGYPPYAFHPPAPNHPQATTAMVLGIVGLAGGFTLCGIGFLASPFAWALGRNAVKEIRASHGRLGGESAAKAGMVMGIIGTVLLFLAVVAIVIFGIAIAVTDSSSGGSNI
jgi:type II secretory pathway pseudopilin PulG